VSSEGWKKSTSTRGPFFEEVPSFFRFRQLQPCSGVFKRVPQASTRGRPCRWRGAATPIETAALATRGAQETLVNKRQRCLYSTMPGMRPDTPRASYPGHRLTNTASAAKRASILTRRSLKKVAV